jgi:hypothetical protein
MAHKLNVDPAVVDEALKHRSDGWIELAQSICDDIDFDLQEQAAERDESDGFPGSGKERK